jgi:hypothetical protein
MEAHFMLSLLSDYRATMRKLGGAFLVIQIAVFGGFTVLAPPANAITKSQIATKVLSLSDMPTGWSVDNSGGGSVSDFGGCLKGLQAIKKRAKGIVRASVGYQEGTVPFLIEIIEAGPGAVARYRKFNAILLGCKAISFSASGSKVTGTVGAMSFPKVGDSSSAYAVTFTVQGETLGVDLVFFRVRQFDGELAYADISPDSNIVQAFVTEVVDKILGKATSPPTET